MGAKCSLSPRFIHFSNADRNESRRYSFAFANIHDELLELLPVCVFL